MKNLILLLMLTFLVASCSKDNCEQDALCTNLSGERSSLDMILVCHNGSTLEIDSNALQYHLDHGDTEGECNTLSDGGLTFMDGAVVQIDCKYTLPFIYVDEAGRQWMYSVPQ